MSRRSTPGTAEVWLATPEAASLFDPSQARQCRPSLNGQPFRRGVARSIGRPAARCSTLSRTEATRTEVSRTAMAFQHWLSCPAQAGLVSTWSGRHRAISKAWRASPTPTPERDYLESAGRPGGSPRDLLPVVDAEGSVREGAGAAPGGCAQAMLLCRLVRHASCRGPDDAVLASDGLCPSSAIAAGRRAHA